MCADRRPPLTLQDVHAVGGLQAAGFVTHPPSELRLRRMLRDIHQRIDTTQQFLALGSVEGLAGTGDRIHMTRRHRTTIQSCGDRRVDSNVAARSITVEA